MSDQSFPRVPVNPRLEFGIPLEKVCKNGELHPGLRELFLKAYLSAGGDDRDEEEQFNRSSKIPYVLEALKAGPKGQGSLTDRISLKLKLESGKWIIATQTPIGAPLWLLRHFLGCLPRPLLDGSHWQEIAVACGAVSCPKGYYLEGKILENIEIAFEALPKENYSILVALILLIRNLSSVTPTQDPDSLTLYQEAVEALSQYFIAAIISRPYRPGLYTRPDKEHKPLLVFLSEHWLEVKKLCRHTGISRYHTTCESRYEFVSPDTDVDHTMWQAMVTAEDIDDKIDVPESFARKSKHHLPQITNPNVQKTEIQGDRIPVTVHTPKGVYFIPSNEECIRMSVADEKDEVIEDSNDVVKFDDRSGQLDVPKVDHLGYHFPCRVVNDKSKTDPRFKVKKLIHKYEPEVMPFTGIQHQAFRCDGLLGKIRVTSVVKAKINGTQTFECEFPEDGQLMEEEKLQEKINEVRISPVRLILKDNDTQQMLEENVLSFANIGSSNVLKFCKIGDKKIDKPLTRSTALLIKNFSSGEEIVYFPARQVDLQNEKVIDEVDQVPGVKEEAVTSKTDKDGKTLTNPFKYLNKLKDQKRNSNYIDFVTELKANFKQGRRKPSDAKSSSLHMILPDDSEPDVPRTTMGKGCSKVFRIVEFLSEKAADFSEFTESSSTQEIFLKTSCAPILSANSI